MKKYKIGYTTGVFDLFHIGHLNILRRAKEECDYLIVGVTTDDEVLRVKNKQPIIPFKERVEIVQALKCVDKAVPEDNVDKLVAWEEYKYNVIFKGDDWKGSSKWLKYEEEFSKRGVEVVYFPYTKGTSSTQLREVLNKIII
ncbi:MAG TPA: adenylyltransferase/cytidyltransferase family protein [Tissierellaceae bacterium]|nr:adenylyltransferase/cytidyltransferase family protein [Tissierellaceae bacterium]